MIQSLEGLAISIDSLWIILCSELILSNLISLVLWIDLKITGEWIAFTIADHNLAPVYYCIASIFSMIILKWSDNFEVFLVFQ